jgi:lipopolysaccharide transport system ATP-binding protein
MNDVAIRVENLSKRYRIGHHHLSKDEALQKVVDDRARERVGRQTKGEQSDPDHVWALRDVSFDVRHGEVWGIVGLNGSGKSTLLKILSRVTQPSHGFVDIRGRVNSLLEVGTGFHPELTGRENIYLNGAILGMKRSDIQRRFDEIVEFSEIGRFIDTPVKRYSSGMYVRLAFAVAAHCEPDILLVDEVLAVGDFPFQAKCLARIEQLSRTASAVLFVSHSLANVKRLCSMALWLDEGAIVAQGRCDSVVDEYVAKVGGGGRTQGPVQVEFPASASPMQVTGMRILTRTGQVALEEIPVEGTLRIEITYTVREPVQSAYVLCCFRNAVGVDVLWTYDGDSSEFGHRRAGRFVAAFEVPEGLLAAGVYWVHCAIVGGNGAVVDSPGSPIAVEVAEIDCLLTRRGIRWPAVTRANPVWSTRQT